MAIDLAITKVSANLQNKELSSGDLVIGSQGDPGTLDKLFRPKHAMVYAGQNGAYESISLSDSEAESRGYSARHPVDNDFLARKGAQAFHIGDDNIRAKFQNELASAKVKFRVGKAITVRSDADPEMTADKIAKYYYKNHMVGKKLGFSKAEMAHNEAVDRLIEQNKREAPKDMKDPQSRMFCSQYVTQSLQNAIVADKLGFPDDEVIKIPFKQWKEQNIDKIRDVVKNDFPKELQVPSSRVSPRNLTNMMNGLSGKSQGILSAIGNFFSDLVDKIFTRKSDKVADIKMDNLVHGRLKNNEIQQENQLDISKPEIERSNNIPIAAEKPELEISVGKLRGLSDLKCSEASGTKATSYRGAEMAAAVNTR